MHEIGAEEAEFRFGELLERVEAGEEILIVRDGTAVARLISSKVSFDPEKARCAAESIRAMSEGTTLGGLELRDLVAEGRL